MKDAFGSGFRGANLGILLGNGGGNLLLGLGIGGAVGAGGAGGAGGGSRGGGSRGGAFFGSGAAAVPADAMPVDAAPAGCTGGAAIDFGFFNAAFNTGLHFALPASWPVTKTASGCCSKGSMGGVCIGSGSSNAIRVSGASSSDAIRVSGASCSNVIRVCSASSGITIRGVGARGGACGGGARVALTATLNARGYRASLATPTVPRGRSGMVQSTAGLEPIVLDANAEDFAKVATDA